MATRSRDMYKVTSSLRNDRRFESTFFPRPNFPTNGFALIDNERRHWSDWNRWTEVCFSFYHSQGDNCRLTPCFVPCYVVQESRAIAGRTARCHCKFRYVSNFTTASYGFSVTVLTAFLYRPMPTSATVRNAEITQYTNYTHTVRWFSRSWLLCGWDQNRDKKTDIVE